MSAVVAGCAGCCGLRKRVAPPPTTQACKAVTGFPFPSSRAPDAGHTGVCCPSCASPACMCACERLACLRGGVQVLQCVSDQARRMAASAGTLTGAQAHLCGQARCALACTYVQCDTRHAWRPPTTDTHLRGSCARARACTHTHTHIHAHTRTYTHIHTHARTHTYTLLTPCACTAAGGGSGSSSWTWTRLSPSATRTCCSRLTCFARCGALWHCVRLHALRVCYVCACVCPCARVLQPAFPFLFASSPQLTRHLALKLA